MTPDGYKFDPKKLGEAHKWNIERAEAAIVAGMSPIIIDNNNLQAWEAKPYVTKALQRGYKVEIAEPQTPWKTNPAELVRRSVRDDKYLADHCSHEDCRWRQYRECYPS
jgi:hypothetical protein